MLLCESVNVGCELSVGLFLKMCSYIPGSNFNVCNRCVVYAAWKQQNQVLY